MTEEGSHQALRAHGMPRWIFQTDLSQAKPSLLDHLIGVTLQLHATCTPAWAGITPKLPVSLFRT